MAEVMVLGSSTDKAKKHSDIRPKILLIDEVDVFFSSDFYGNKYSPIATLRDETISDLIKYAWNNKGDKTKLRYSNFITSKAYLDCVVKFKVWKSLVDECVKCMLGTLRALIRPEVIHNYIRLPHGIGYKYQDGISDTLSYGFSTIFAHLKEYDANTKDCVISPQLLQKILGFPIYLGSFSYAAMPALYDKIMGVSGTLKQLGKEQIRIIQNDFGIKKSTYMPSTYGDCKRKDHVTIISTSKEFSLDICRDIIKNLGDGKDSKPQRAVLVFFESMTELNNFRELPHVKKNLNLDHVYIYTESTPAEPFNRKAVIDNAVTSGKITFMTKAFGRGTDFFCYDQKLKQAGGVHVIQTFLSEDVAEEVQIKGRTARQSNEGSYVKIIDEASLQKFNISSSEANTIRSNLHDTKEKALDKKRGEYFELEYMRMTSNLDQVTKEHQESLRFKEALIKNNPSFVSNFILERNRASDLIDESSKVLKTLVLMDATGSMSGLLNAAKNTVNEMFKRIKQVLKELNNTSPFQIQFAVYRNYNVYANQLLEYSNWCSEPHELSAYLGGIGPAGGIGNEAVEIGFQHANREHVIEPISQICLIGDVPPNTRAEAIDGRARYCGGEAYWASTQFGPVTDWEVEMRKLIEHEIPVHAFYVNNNAKSAFEKIATMSGPKGSHAFLDVNDPQKGPDLLIDRLSTCTLKDVGGDAAVEKYNALKQSAGFTA